MPPLQKLTRLVKGAELRETLFLKEAELLAINPLHEVCLGMEAYRL